MPIFMAKQMCMLTDIVFLCVHLAGPRFQTAGTGDKDALVRSTALTACSDVAPTVWRLLAAGPDLDEQDNNEHLDFLKRFHAAVSSRYLNGLSSAP